MDENRILKELENLRRLVSKTGNIEAAIALFQEVKERIDRHSERWEKTEDKIDKFHEKADELLFGDGVDEGVIPIARDNRRRLNNMQAAKVRAFDVIISLAVIGLGLIQVFSR